MNALFRVNWKKRICSLLLSLTLMGSMAAVAGAQQTPVLHTETVEFSQYLQSASEQTQSAASVSLLAMDQNAKVAETAISEGLMNGVSVLDLRQ